MDWNFQRPSYSFRYETSGNHIPGSRSYSDLWIPEQTLFASTSSYSSLVQRLPVKCRRQLMAFQLMHSSLVHKMHLVAHKITQNTIH